MKNLTIGKRLVLSFCAALLITAALGGFSYSRFAAIKIQSQLIRAKVLPGIYLVGQIESLANENSTLVLKNLSSVNEEIKAEFAARLRTNVTAIAALAKAFSGVAEASSRKDLFLALNTARLNYETNLLQVIHLSGAGQTQAAMELKASALDPAFEKFMASVHSQVSESKMAGERSGQEIQTAVASAQRGIAIGLFVALGAGIGLSLLIKASISLVLREATELLTQASQRVEKTAGALSQASAKLAEGSCQQASSLEQTSASLEEMASMTQRSAESAQAAKGLATHTSQAANAGMDSMKAMSAAIAGIQTSGLEMRNAVNEIQTASVAVSKIVRSIDEIAFQTNILALNAAVEAARAGEAGLGFAVVADEVRNLAQRSAQAARESATMIENSIKKSEQGVEVSAKAAQNLAALEANAQRVQNSFAGIVAKTRETDEVIAQVALASKEQSQGIKQITSAISEMDTLTQGAAANAEQTSRAAAGLTQDAQHLMEAVARLQQLVTGKDNHLPPPSSVSPPLVQNTGNAPLREKISAAPESCSAGRTEVPPWPARGGENVTAAQTKSELDLTF